MTTTVTIGQVPINTTYTGVTGATGGSGTGALFNVTKTNGLYTTVIDPAHLGSGYAVGDTVTISGSVLGGGATNYDILTIGSVTTGGHIATFGAVGVGQIGNGTIYTIIDVTGSTSYTFTDKSSNFSLVNDTTNNNLIVTSVLDNTVSFKLEGVNRVNYTDKSTAFDITGHAGDVYALLKASLGGTVNTTYEGIGIKLEDAGQTSSQIAQAILNSSVFATAAGGTDYTSFVNQVYTNVVGVAPTTAQAVPFITQLATGQATEAQLLTMAAHLTTFQQTIGLVGVAPATTGVLSTSGIDYIPA
jgi:hypothetical protein